MSGPHTFITIIISPLLLFIMLVTRLSRIVLMVRPGDALVKATEFYQHGLGLAVVRATDEWVELQLPNISLSLHAATTEAQVSSGYTPLLQFYVNDMDSVVAKCMQLGAHLDGPIQYPAHGKVAALRSPDGHMIGLYEPSAE